MTVLDADVNPDVVHFRLAFACIILLVLLNEIIVFMSIGLAFGSAQLAAVVDDDLVWLCLAS